MSCAANTLDVFRWAIGKRVVGMYTESREIAGRTVVLVLDDGTAVAFAGNGSHWVVSKDDVRMHAAQRREELERVARDLRDVLITEAALGKETT